MINPWDTPPPALTHRVVGTVAGHGYTGPWVTLGDAQARVRDMPPEYGTGFHIESKAEVERALAAKESVYLEERRWRLDAQGAPSVQEAQEAMRRRHALELPIGPVAPAIERGPFRGAKEALGDYAAHSNGPCLAQGGGAANGPHNPAWLVVGSCLTLIGAPPNSALRKKLLTWATSADDRRGTGTGMRLAGSDWGKLRELRMLLTVGGVIEQK